MRNDLIEFLIRFGVGVFIAIAIILTLGAAFLILFCLIHNYFIWASLIFIFLIGILYAIFGEH